MNLDFVTLNLTGFLFYSSYNIYGYFFDESQTGEVDFNDIIFAVHASFATIVCLVQSWIYPRGDNKVHRPTKIFLFFIWGFVIIYGIFTLFFAQKNEQYKNLLKKHPHLGVFSFMGYFKLCITLIKYLPQMYWNYKRKSTEGWSIFNVIMDLTGGILSFLQMILEKVFWPDTPINFVKVLLGSATLIYDTFFVLQHFKWYRKDRQ